MNESRGSLGEAALGRGDVDAADADDAETEGRGTKAEAGDKGNERWKEREDKARGICWMAKARRGGEKEEERKVG